MSDTEKQAIATLVADWQAAGISTGDTVLVHSNSLRTYQRLRELMSPERPSVNHLLDSFLQAVGPDGTMLFPLFNFGFCSGEPFDVRSTRSRMGSLTEAARKHADSVRTGHPVYSFAVIGALSQRFAGVNNRSAYGSDSPFAMLRELGGKIASLDLCDQDSMTFYHHVEEMNEVPYRYMKEFTSNYTGAAGDCKAATFSIYVRDLERGVQTHVNAAGELLWESGVYSGCRPMEGSGLRVADANKMYDFVDDLIKSDRALGLLYTTNPS